MLTIGSIVWAVRDVPRAIEFWCAAFNYKPLREPDKDWAIFIPEHGEGPQIAINEVSADHEKRHRHHLDLYASNQSVEVERLLSIGAQRLERTYPEGAEYVVLADPDGNPFCVIEKEGRVASSLLSLRNGPEWGLSIPYIDLT
jgi:catechol 2,3-dioxygenase-like lactoylglutathione lyase family enzyme